MSPENDRDLQKQGEPVIMNRGLTRPELRENTSERNETLNMVRSQRETQSFLLHADGMIAPFMEHAITELGGSRVELIPLEPGVAQELSIKDNPREKDVFSLASLVLTSETVSDSPYADLRFDQESRSVSFRGQTIRMTSLESQLLGYFLGNPYVLITQEELQQRLSSAKGNFPSHEHIKVNLSSMRGKLKRLMGNAFPILTVHGEGLMFAPWVKRETSQ